MAQPPSFRGVVCLAPMVRAGTLPLRLLALENGADLVWSEEIIARKMAACERVEHPRGTVDFVAKGGNVVFQTASAEQGKCVFQVESLLLPAP
jgi:tRNA-dihydrouridine synthase 2